MSRVEIRLRRQASDGHHWDTAPALMVEAAEAIEKYRGVLKHLKGNHDAYVSMVAYVALGEDLPKNHPYLARIPTDSTAPGPKRTNPGEPE